MMEPIIFWLNIRPAFKLAMLWIAGLIIGYYFDFSPTVLSLALVTALIAASFGLCGKVSLLNFGLIIAVILAGLIRYELATRIIPANHISRFVDSGQPVTVLGEVACFPHRKQQRIDLEVAVRQIGWSGSLHAVCGKVLVRLWRIECPFNQGDRLQVTGKLESPPGQRNPGEFDYRKFLASKGIFGIIDVAKPEAVSVLSSHRHLSFADFISARKNEFYRSLQELYPGQPGALIQALLLGERGEIDPELNDAFARCGVIHALAISGLHVGYVSIIFFVLFGLLRFNYASKIIAVLVSLMFYNMIIGFQPPIVRASLMLAIFLIGRLLQRSADPLNVISIAAIIILLIHPMDLFQASFQLSFAATLAIVFLYQRLKNFFDRIPIFIKLARSKLGNYVGSLFLVSAAAQLGTLPVTAYYFGRISIIAFVLNLLVIPLVGIVIALGLASMVASMVSMPLARYYANANMLFLDKVIQLVDVAGSWRFSAVEIGAISLISIAAYYGLLGIVFQFDRRMCRKALVYLSLVGVLLLIWQPIVQHGRWLEVIFFDVGQGDAALVRFPDGKSLLIDGGPIVEDFDSGKAIIVPYLKRHRIDRLAAVVVSHADNDHIGGIPSVLQNIPADRIYDNGLLNPSGICSAYQAIIEKGGMRYYVARGGHIEPASNGGAIWFLHPSGHWVRRWSNDINNCSVVAKLAYGRRSFLFAGDIGIEAEQRLLHYGHLLKSDVLKVAHHGSQTSSSPPWLHLVQPEYAVISVGKNNKFGFPAPSVLRRLDQLGIKTIRTDINGAVVFRTNGEWLKRVR